MRLLVTSRDGEQLSLSHGSGGSLMIPLRDAGLVEAVCGGQAACATCHVHVDEIWLARIGPPTAQEADLLDNSLERTAQSRLSCQVEIDESLDGITLSIAPSEG